jgi:hypothetical protein
LRFYKIKYLCIQLLKNQNGKNKKYSVPKSLALLYRCNSLQQFL